MATDRVNVKIKGDLQVHLEQQIGDDGLYDNASEYIRDLIRQDLKGKDEAWQWLKSELEPAMRASDDDFITVSADDVINRNKVSI